jgi:hypothetical protein
METYKCSKCEDPCVITFETIDDGGSSSPKICPWSANLAVWVKQPDIAEPTESDRLLIELNSLLKCTHLDMGGQHKYMVTHKTQPVLREIKEYVREIGNTCHDTHQIKRKS